VEDERRDRDVSFGRRTLSRCNLADVVVSRKYTCSCQLSSASLSTSHAGQQIALAESDDLVNPDRAEVSGEDGKERSSMSSKKMEDVEEDADEEVQVSRLTALLAASTSTWKSTVMIVSPSRTRTGWALLDLRRLTSSVDIYR
jgi:hypothetical protein